jgi:hypothetical protein
LPTVWTAISRGVRFWRGRTLRCIGWDALVRARDAGEKLLAETPSDTELLSQLSDT